MNFIIPTIDDITAKYQDFNIDSDEAVQARAQELASLTKAELIDLLIEKERTKRTDTVQELAKAILKDEEFIAADYETIAQAIRVMKPEAKTSSKSIASYVSKKREEWELPMRVRVTKQRAPKEEETAEATE